MEREKQHKRAFGLMAAVLLVAFLAIPTTLAEEPGLAPRAADDVDAPQGADDNVLEVGVWWINDYPACCKWISGVWTCGDSLCDLHQCDDDAQGLKDQLGYGGWTKRFDFPNGRAWEEDFKGLNKPGGGTEWYYVDSVDLAYFSGHGGSDSLSFGVGGRDHDDEWLTYNDCLGDWGDGDMEWMAFNACQVLADAHRDDWSRCMDGLHLILGSVTNMADTSQGAWFGWLLRNGYNMTQAWFASYDVAQPSGRIARVLAEDYHHFWDRPSFHNIADPTDRASYWYWDHHTGSAPPLGVEMARLEGEMPVFLTPRMTLDEANAQWAQLGTAFGVTTPGRRGVRSVAEDEIWLSEDGQLRMDPSSGLYGYTELDNLWAPPPAGASAERPSARLSDEEARAIADQFLTDNDLMPADARFDHVVPDVNTEVALTASGLGSASVLQREETALQVVYQRVVTYTPPSALRTAEAPLAFSVMGPGAKLKVFVDPRAAPGRSLAGPAADAVIGGVGGWRGVGQAAVSGPIVQATVPILSYGQIEALFRQLEPMVALSYIPLLAENRQVLSHTVAYYEHPLGTGQDQLIPVYALEVKYTLESQETMTDTVYIPANPEYMAPLALISPTLEIPDKVQLGQEVALEAVDAASRLSDVGYDAALDFALGTGDPDSYLYTWYRDTVSEETQIGTGREFTYTAGLGGETHLRANPILQTIILEVTDSLSPRPPSASYDQFQLAVVAPIHLPLVVRDR
jgi:hypothetical protein